MSQALHCQLLNTANFRSMHLCIPNILFVVGVIKGCGVKREDTLSVIDVWLAAASESQCAASCCLPRKCVLKNPSPATCTTPVLSTAMCSCWTFDSIRFRVKGPAQRWQQSAAAHRKGPDKRQPPVLSRPQPGQLGWQGGRLRQSCQSSIFAGTQTSPLISSFLCSSTTRAMTMSSASSSRRTAVAWASQFQATSVTWIQVVKSEFSGSLSRLMQDPRERWRLIHFSEVSHQVHT